MTTLMVGLDPLAHLRNLGGGRDPDPVAAAVLAELAGAGGIRVTLAPSAEGVGERDIHMLREVVRSVLGLWIAPEENGLKLALAVRPDLVTLIPGAREGLGRDGGLDVEDRRAELAPVLETLKGGGILAAVAVDPLPQQVKAAQRAGAGAVLLHAGRFCWATTDASRAAEFEALDNAAKVAQRLGLIVHAGGGIGYQSAGEIAAIPEIAAVDIGHAVIARATLVGMREAVRELRGVLRDDRR
jgi:pyridoxine 5-phosphate synthase